MTSVKPMFYILLLHTRHVKEPGLHLEWGDLCFMHYPKINLPWRGVDAYWQLHTTVNEMIGKKNGKLSN
jgi:hypothetical protein